jgi:hypothetical protein
LPADYEGHQVAMLVGDVSRRFFNLHVEALCGARHGAQRRLGAKWCSPRRR